MSSNIEPTLVVDASRDEATVTKDFLVYHSIHVAPERVRIVFRVAVSEGIVGCPIISSISNAQSGMEPAVDAWARKHVGLAEGKTLFEHIELS